MTEVSKPKIYLETTVFNYYFDEDRNGHEDVVALFDRIKHGAYQAYTSGLVLYELRNAAEPKRGMMLALQDEFSIIELDVNDDIRALAREYIAQGAIPARYSFDALHIATASVHGMDAIISYNLTHINRDKTREVTAKVNLEKGHSLIKICGAREVLNDEDL